VDPGPLGLEKGTKSAGKVKFAQVFVSFYPVLTNASAGKCMWHGSKIITFLMPNFTSDLKRNAICDNFCIKTKYPFGLRNRFSLLTDFTGILFNFPPIIYHIL
jgi:hypothetical protein